jgi:tryptophanyl-tRNA synthetase
MLSAMQPTNDLMLGNYIGALKNWVDLQSQYDCLFFAVDLHAITVRQDPAELHKKTLQNIALYLAAGIDQKNATLFIQSHVPEHSELGWIALCHSSMGELSRMTQFKDKSQKAGTHIPSGLFAYPALMAADILLYGTHLVPVGEDQKQHLELARDIAQRMNQTYRHPGAKEGEEDLFVVPEPYIAKVGARIMSLQNPDQKMSKSDPDLNATVFLTDPDSVILKKVKRAVTDSGSEITWSDDKPGIKNLLTIQSCLTGKPVSELVESYQGKQYGHLKVDTADIIVAAISPIRTEAERMLQDRGELERILAQGAERARARAHQTMTRVADRLGFVRPFSRQ